MLRTISLLYSTHQNSGRNGTHLFFFICVQFSNIPNGFFVEIKPWVIESLISMWLVEFPSLSRLFCIILSIFEILILWSYWSPDPKVVFGTLFLLTFVVESITYFLLFLTSSSLLIPVPLTLGPYNPIVCVHG